jgi:hypothetical protein
MKLLAPAHAAETSTVVKRVGRFTISTATPPVSDAEAARVEELQSEIEGLGERLRTLAAENLVVQEKAKTMSSDVESLVNRT